MLAVIAKLNVKHEKGQNSKSHAGSCEKVTTNGRQSFISALQDSDGNYIVMEAL